MLIINPIDLFGDYLGTLPAVIDFVRYSGKNNLKLICQKSIQPLNDLLPDDIKSLVIYDNDLNIKGYQLDREYWAGKYSDYEMPVCLDLHKAFEYATMRGMYMGGAYYSQLKRDVKTLRAELVIFPEDPGIKVDYVISPFSRCLPPEQKVSREIWQAFVNNHPSLSFAVIGTDKYDDPNYLQGANVIPYFNHSWNQVGNLIKSSTALLSVITGTSHLAFHIGAKNIVFSNQAAAWGCNPQAILDRTIIRKNIPSLTADDIIQSLNLIK